MLTLYQNWDGTHRGTTMKAPEQACALQSVVLEGVDRIFAADEVDLFPGFQKAGGQAQSHRPRAV